MVAEVRERLAVSKQAAHKLEGERFNLRKLEDLEVKKQYQIEITNRFAALGNISDDGDINRAWGMNDRRPTLQHSELVTKGQGLSDCGSQYAFQYL